MSDELAGKAAIVTGAASGIGRACARLLGSRGAKVALVDLDEDALRALAEELGGADVALPLRLSITSESDMARMAESTLETFGRIDHLVACAGILRTGGSLQTLADTSLEDWETIVRTNLTGTFLSNRAVLPAMLAQREGDIVNLSSTSGRQGRPFDGPYCASKFGIIGLSESLAEEVSSHGIRVQTLLPDAVETPLWDQNGPHGLRPTHALPPERVAEVILYMLTLPRDTYLLNTVVAPFKTRKKRRRGG
jgi:NAD(P)-dependent dehydrogenase (short-subunit alcohol dehydrogenase family)